MFTLTPAYSSVEFEKIRHHLSSLVERHRSLLKQVTDEEHPKSDDAEREGIYRTLAGLEVVVRLVNELKDKEKVWFVEGYTTPQ